jgi:Tol biopolymer transport system component
VAVARNLKSVSDVWIVDASRGGWTRVTSGGPNSQPVRSPDGQRIAYISTRNGASNICVRSLSDSSEPDQPLFTSATLKGVTDWSTDGRFLLFTNVEIGSVPQLWTYSFAEKRATVLAAAQNADLAEGKFSPDGRWVAYQSNQSGRYEVYVRPFERPGDSVSVSRAGGAQVRWRADGRELYYLNLESRLMAVPVQTAGAAVTFGEPAPLFGIRVPQGVVQTGGAHQQYDVSPDGQRFLVNMLVPDPASPPIVIILNWRPHADPVPR